MSQISEGEARAWASALGQEWTTAGAQMDVSRLRCAGWTVEPPPEPRYHVKESPVPGRWLVWDSQDSNEPRAAYGEKHPDAEAAATAEVRRLNAGDYGGDA